MSDLSSKTVAVVGLEHVSLPLPLAFGRKLHTVGFDINESRRATYQEGQGLTGEMAATRHLVFTSDSAQLGIADLVVVAVPTPIKQPDLTPVVKATKAIALHLKPDAIVVYESTVYRAPSIRVAEAAENIENTQRDANIAPMSELAIIFNWMDYRYSGGIGRGWNQMECSAFPAGLGGGIA